MNEEEGSILVGLCFCNDGIYIAETIYRKERRKEKHKSVPFILLSVHYKDYYND